MIPSKWKEHSCETEDILLINSHKRCASYRWEFQRTSWGLDSQSQSVKWYLDTSPSKCLGVLVCPWKIRWRFCCIVNLQGLQHHTGERRFKVSAAYDALAGGRKVFPALQLGFLLPVGTHKSRSLLKMKQNLKVNIWELERLLNGFSVKAG